MTAGDWAAAHSAAAPGPLRERVLGTLAGVTPGGSIPETLALAADVALSRVLEETEGGRELALDLLCADALITQALEAQADRDPAGLEAFAALCLDAALQA